MDQMILSFLIFWPLVAGLGIALWPVRDARASWIAALVASGIEAVFALTLLSGFQTGLGGAQFEVNALLLKSAGVHFHLGVDGLSLVLVLLIALLTPVALFASRDVSHHQRFHHASMLALAGAMAGAVLALDTLLFYVFFELMLVPAFFLVGRWGGEKRLEATTRFVVYTLLGSLPLLVALLGVGAHHLNVTGQWSFDLPDLMATPLAGNAMWLGFWAFIFAFAIKAGLFPFHGWAPDTYVEAPTPVTFLLSGVMGKIGVYGILRFALPLFPVAAQSARSGLMALALVGTIYAAWLALVQTDLKRLLAYSSISHMALLLMGVFSLDSQAWSGAVFMFLAHALATGGLFLLVGMLAERRGTSIAQFGGIARQVPWLTTVFLIIAMASVGLPGLNGFVAEFLILMGAFTSNGGLGVVATTGVIWGACYMLWMIARTFFGSVPAPAKGAKPAPELRDLALREAVMLVPMILVIIWTGFQPQPVLDRIDPSVQAILSPIQKAVVPASNEAAAHASHGG